MVWYPPPIPALFCGLCADRRKDRGYPGHMAGFLSVPR